MMQRDSKQQHILLGYEMKPTEGFNNKNFIVYRKYIKIHQKFERETQKESDTYKKKIKTKKKKN